jgi:hypothetical protein
MKKYKFNIQHADENIVQNQARLKRSLCTKYIEKNQSLEEHNQLVSTIVFTEINKFNFTRFKLHAR